MRLLLIVGALLLVGVNYFAAVRTVGDQANAEELQATLLDLQQTLDADHKQFGAEKVAFLTDISELETSKLEQQISLEAANDRESLLSTELEQLRLDLESAQSKQDAATQESKDLLTQVASQTDAMTTLNSKLSDAQTMIEDLKAGVEEHQHEAGLLRSELVVARQEAEASTARILALSDDKQSLPVPAASDAEIASLKETVRNKNRVLKEIFTRIDGVNAASDEQALALSTTQSKVASLNEEVASLRDDNVTLNEEIASLRDGNVTLVAEVASLGADKVALSDALSQRDSKLEELRASVVVPVIQTVESCTEQTSSLLVDNNINFRIGTNNIAESSFGILEQLAAVAVSCMTDDLVVTIGGHTDSLGAVTDNQRLSENRADAVRSFFAARGLPADAIQVVGYGEADPIADNATDEGRAQNRRVTFEWQQRGSL